MSDTIENALEMIANNLDLPGMASTREGYEGVCGVLRDWGWRETSRTEEGREYTDLRGNKKFLPYSWFNKIF